MAYPFRFRFLHFQGEWLAVESDGVRERGWESESKKGFWKQKSHWQEFGQIRSLIKQHKFQLSISCWMTGWLAG